MIEKRCGHVTNSSVVDGAGDVCCWRLPWEGHDRCLWHTDAVVPTPIYERNTPASGERLDGANFEGASLSRTSFLAGRSLIEADFTGAILDGADLSGADLRQSTFRDIDAHGASFRDANLHDAVFVFADLRGADFRNARLYRAGLTDVRLNVETTFGERPVYETEIDGSHGVTERAEAAQWVYRELQRLYDENALPERVHEYYLREKHFRRRRAWQTGDYRRAITLAGSRWIMRYGTSPWRVVATSLVLILVCAALYPLTGGIQEVGTETAIAYRIRAPAQTPVWFLAEAYFKSLYFSVVTFATLGYGDLQPVGSAARAIAAVETLLGSLLVALLVFVLTQRVRH
ncbi:pentapeptide repeat-containing protein [Natrinema sp. 74]|uniref:pentapeptide repeat-containing protein n=1 Tax=Natrinema sp. 74 TaxID=3384159 RepID=UPI0038D449B6